MATANRRQRLTTEREVELGELAEYVAETYCKDREIDPERVVRAKNIHLDYDDYGDSFDGMLEHEDGEFFIHCNVARENFQGSPRARFTIAHELGHYFIDDHRNALASGLVGPHPSFSDKGVGELLVEREADFFASRLLLPDRRLRRSIKSKPIDLECIKTVASDFGVSLTCTAIRFVTAEFRPCVVIKWSPEGFAWRWCSKQFWVRGFRGVHQEYAKLPSDSPTAEAIQAHGQGTTYSAGACSTAAAWFPAIGHASPANVVLLEEAVTLGKYRALTLLSLRDAEFPAFVKPIYER